MQAFLNGTVAVDFSVAAEERYDFIARTVRRFGYRRLKRAEKAVVLRFLERVSGYSRQQLTRLVKRGGERAYRVFADARYERLATLSVAHLYNLRKQSGYQRHRRAWTQTRPVAIAIGDLNDRAWRGVARQLAALGLLHADPRAYGALWLTAAAAPVLKGERRLALRRPSECIGQPARKLRLGATVASADPAAETLFHTLRAQRKRIADEQGVPAFVVLHDATLRELAQLRPRDPQGLLQVSGIGAAKAKRYGDWPLAVIGNTPSARA